MDEPRMTLQTLAILKVLLAKPLESRYGLDISHEAGLKSGTLYPALARLAGAGWLTSFQEDIDEAAEGRRKRRYYRLTAEGAVKARQALETESQRLSLPSFLPSPGPKPTGAGA
jgi:PadR family transcriptional regulator, regulatory protein PadR